MQTGCRGEREVQPACTRAPPSSHPLTAQPCLPGGRAPKHAPAAAPALLPSAPPQSSPGGGRWVGWTAAATPPPATSSSGPACPPGASAPATNTRGAAAAVSGGRWTDERPWETTLCAFQPADALLPPTPPGSIRWLPVQHVQLPMMPASLSPLACSSLHATAFAPGRYSFTSVATGSCTRNKSNKHDDALWVARAELQRAHRVPCQRGARRCTPKSYERGRCWRARRGGRAVQRGAQGTRLPGRTCLIHACMHARMHSNTLQQDECAPQVHLLSMRQRARAAQAPPGRACL